MRLKLGDHHNGTSISARRFAIMSGERDELEKRLTVCSELRRRQKNLLLTIPPGAEYDAARSRMIELVHECRALEAQRNRMLKDARRDVLRKERGPTHD